MTKELYEAKEKEIEDIRAEYAGIVADLETRLDAARRTRDDKVSQVMQERDAVALEIKLKDFPAKLVREHKDCSICGGLMRPFRITDGQGNITKVWACQGGSLQPTHDMIVVE